MYFLYVLSSTFDVFSGEWVGWEKNVKMTFYLAIWIWMPHLKLETLKKFKPEFKGLLSLAKLQMSHLGKRRSHIIKFQIIIKSMQVSGKFHLNIRRDCGIKESSFWWITNCPGAIIYCRNKKAVNLVEFPHQKCFLSYLFSHFT